MWWVLGLVVIGEVTLGTTLTFTLPPGKVFVGLLVVVGADGTGWETCGVVVMIWGDMLFVGVGDGEVVIGEPIYWNGGGVAVVGGWERWVMVEVDGDGALPSTLLLLVLIKMWGLFMVGEKMFCIVFWFCVWASWSWGVGWDMWMLWWNGCSSQEKWKFGKNVGCCFFVCLIVVWLYELMQLLLLLCVGVAKDFGPIQTIHCKISAADFNWWGQNSRLSGWIFEHDIRPSACIAIFRVSRGIHYAPKTPTKHEDRSRHIITTPSSTNTHTVPNNRWWDTSTTI